MRGFLVLLFALVACGSPHLDRTGFDKSVCTNGSHQPLAGVVFSSDVYVELDANRTMQTNTASMPMRSLLASSGTPCTKAANKLACMDAIENAQPAAQTWATGTCSGAGCIDEVRFFVTESAGTVRVVDTMDELRALVAPIDNANDAALVAVMTEQLDGIDCSAPQIKALPDGSFDVFLDKGDGHCSNRLEKVVHVNVDGTTVVKMTLENKASSQCISP